MIDSIGPLNQPPYPAAIDPNNPLSQGLLFYAPCWAGGGPAVNDLAGGLTLPLAGGATWKAGDFGMGLACTASGAGAQATTPLAIQVTYPITLVCRVAILGSQAGQGLILGIWKAGTSPLSIFFNSGQTASPFVDGSISAASFGTLSVGSEYTLAVAVTGQGGGSVNAWAIPVSGAIVAATAANTKSAALDLTNIAIGDSTTFSGRTSNTLTYYGAAWSRALSASEVLAMHYDPFQIVDAPGFDWAKLPPSTGVFVRRSLYRRAGSRGVM